MKTVIEWLAYRKARRIIVLSAAFKQVLVDTYGVNPERVVVISPGVDLEHFQPGSMAEARRRLGLPEGGRLIAAVRRFTPRMGLETLIRAWAVAAPKGAVLAMAGTGPDRQRIEQLAADLGCAASVRFLGRLSDTDVAALYRAADLTVVPSDDLEGYGLVVLESLASGTPVIASDSGGLAEALAGFSEQLVFPAGDSVRLSELISGALSGRVSVPSVTECRARASSHAWDQVAARHVNVYWEAIGGQLKPAARDKMQSP
jgi:glycosyltransferase involved in cell wall biosynthesis